MGKSKIAEAPRSAGLSKSRVMAGLQCHKLLWWMVHEPTAPELELDDQAQSAMDRGSRVGEIARSYVPGGVAIDLPHNAYDERVAITRQGPRGPRAGGLRGCIPGGWRICRG